MSDTETTEENGQIENTGLETNSNGELSHSDKMIGVFTEPGKMFERTSKFPPRHKDWVIPLLVLFILIGITRSISMLDEEVFYTVKQEQIEQVQQSIEDGTRTPEEGEQTIEAIEQQMEFMRGPVGWIINIVATIIFGFIFFFIIVGIYFFFIKAILKGEGTYGSAMVANGLTAYISVIQVVIAAILTMVMGKMMQETSLASFMGSDKDAIIGWVYAKINPFSIWAYIVLSIGFAKMFKSQSSGKYYALVFGLWLIGGLLIFFLAQAVPFLSFLNQ